MPEEEKPFLAVKNGWSMQITPRSAAGWRALGLWLVAAGLLTCAFVWVVSGAGDDRDRSGALVATALFVLAMTGWAAAMIRWMYARSEVIDVRKLADQQRRSRSNRL